MRVRKSFQHWLGTDHRLPSRRLTEDEVLRCYKILRHGKSLKAKTIARNFLIMNHLGLGFAHATRFVASRPNQADEIVDEMIFGVIQGVLRMEEGSIDHHETPNIAGYLVKMATGRMIAFIQHRPPELLPQPRKSKQLDSLELRELIDKSITTPQERMVIDFRAEGYKDSQIGAMMDLTASRVQQIRNAVKTRLAELLK